MKKKGPTSSEHTENTEKRYKDKKKFSVPFCVFCGLFKQ